ncbi:hypothetical protein CLIB1423_01S09076 [[Candida] railenensis]|uniref:Uncharacterized protein n=1 Tax=[Candida] railenensis TaxID=45579 RepID=A0A9P0QKT7_9ASCO|nr:hypothetical protein CLIB1423_01S09076 [[Candida] railenensis]
MHSAAIVHNVGHRQGVLSLYRSLLRNINKIQNGSFQYPLSQSMPNSFPMSQEIKKYNLNSELYLKYMQSELRRSIQLEFRSKKKSEQQDINKIRDKIESGIELDSVLEALNTNKVDNIRPFYDLLSIVISFRNIKINEQHWRAEYLQDPEAIDSERKKEMSPLQAKRFDTIKQREKSIKQNSKSISKLHHERDKLKRVREERKQSHLNSLRVLQRYFKKLQGYHLIPNPSLLPYTPEEIDIVDVEHSPMVKEKTLMEAYDWEYIEAIIKPGLAYDINFHHYYENYKHIVEKKGPYKVHIRTTEAGPLPMPYLELPFPRLAEMKQIALDIKRSLKLFRLKMVWEVTQQTMSQITEPKFKDGSFNVKGSKGFRTGPRTDGDEERVFPKSHYEKWCKWEADWEYSMELERGGDRSGSSRAFFVSQWMESLDISSQYLDRELAFYFTHYKDLVKDPNSQIYQDQKKYQEIMDQHYDNLLKTYRAMSKELVKSKLFKHGELVNGNSIGNDKTFKDLVSVEDSRSRHSKVGGIPELERIGMKMQLGDYLSKYGLKNFQWGYKFDKKFKF